MENKRQITKKINVALYIMYEESNFDELKKKEDILIKYCENNNYNIVKKYFSNDGYTGIYFSNTMRNLLKEKKSPRNYDILVTCDINDLCMTMRKVVAIAEVLKDEDVEIETINQGVLDEDMLMDVCYFTNVFGKKELYEPRIIYDDKGNVIDKEEAPF